MVCKTRRYVVGAAACLVLVALWAVLSRTPSAVAAKGGNGGGGGKGGGGGTVDQLPLCVTFADNLTDRIQSDWLWPLPPDPDPYYPSYCDHDPEIVTYSTDGFVMDTQNAGPKAHSGKDADVNDRKVSLDFGALVELAEPLTNQYPTQAPTGPYDVYMYLLDENDANGNRIGERPNIRQMSDGESFYAGMRIMFFDDNGTEWYVHFGYGGADLVSSHDPVLVTAHNVDDDIEVEKWEITPIGASVGRLLFVSKTKALLPYGDYQLPFTITLTPDPAP